MSELLRSMTRQAGVNTTTITQEQAFSRGQRNDPGWGAYDNGVDKYNHDLAFVLDYQPLQQFIHGYCEEHRLPHCSVADYLGTGVVRHLPKTRGVSFSFAHAPSFSGEYIDGNIFSADPWKQGHQWLHSTYARGEISSPHFDISISRALAGISGMIRDPEPYAILLRRAYRLMHPTRGVLLFQAFLPSLQYEQTLESWKQLLKEQHVDFTFSSTSIRLDRHAGSPNNLPLPR